jgi:2-polyprenyl-6-hydroxyphenyl methylase/3-demethylubiquinone-9 3-methyltransferase
MAFIKEKVGLHFNIPENALKPFQGLRILDVGCGGGLLCEPLARLGAEVVGIDPVEESIEVARHHAAQMNLSPMYLPCSIEDLPENLPLFDVIIASEIIEHVTDPHAFINACVARLKPSGGMVLTTFNKTLKSYLLGIVAAEYVLGWAPRGTHSWNQFISPQDLSQLLSSVGLGDQELTGVAFSPFKREWVFSASTDVNYFLWAGRG